MAIFVFFSAAPVHTKKSVAGENHPQFKHGRDTKQAKEQYQKTIVRMRFLEDLGHHIKLFHEKATKTRGRKPNGYVNLNLADPEQLNIATMKSSDNIENNY